MVAIEEGGLWGYRKSPMRWLRMKARRKLKNKDHDKLSRTLKKEQSLMRNWRSIRREVEGHLTVKGGS